MSDESPGVALLAPLQRGLCKLYRIEASLDVRQFIVDDSVRRRLGVARAPREQLLVRQPDGEEVELALFVDEEVLGRLAGLPVPDHIRGAGLDEFCVVLEGVSHFVYLVHRAGQNRAVSALELELQAEIDKYVTCVLETWDAPEGPPSDLRARLFERFTLLPDLPDEERDRYLTATREASLYAKSLEERFVRGRSLTDMLSELRRVFRLGYQEKVEAIHRLAA